MDNKIIEEMAKVINNPMLNYCRELNKCKEVCLYRGKSCRHYTCRDYAYAEALYNAGYRKIPENAVVLTMEEYDKLILLKDDYVNGYEAGVEEAWDDACEVTAEKFAERLKETLNDYRLDNEYFIENEPNGNLWQMNSSIFYLEVLNDGGLIDEIAKEIAEGKV